MPKKPTSLATYFLPETYELEVKVSPNSKTFAGSLILTGKKIGRPTKRITLHQTGLRIQDAAIRKVGKKNLQISYEPSRINIHKSFHHVRLHTDQPLYPGSYLVTLHYSGIYSAKIKQLLDNLKSGDLDPNQHYKDLMPCIDELEAWKNSKIELS